MTKRVANSVQFLVGLLVAGEYARLYQLDKEKQLSADLLCAAVQGYGGHLTLPPPPFPRIDIYTQASIPYQQFLDVRLWVDGEESDLTLQCTLFSNEKQGERYAYTVTDILVM